MRIFVSSSLLVAAALFAAPGAMAQAPQNAPFCLKSGSGVTNCIYQTMAQCEQIKQSNDQCLSRAQAGGTTGAGGNTPAPGLQPPVGGNPPPQQR
jgi:hypothetical protein